LTIKSKDDASQNDVAVDHDQGGSVQGKGHAQKTKIVLGNPLYFAVCGDMCNMLGGVDEQSNGAVIEYLARALRTNIESNEAATYVIPLCRIRSATSQPKGMWMKLFHGVGSMVDRFTNNAGHFLSMVIHVRPKQTSNRIHVELIDSKGEGITTYMKMNDFFLQSFTDALLDVDDFRQSLGLVLDKVSESDPRPSSVGSPRSVVHGRGGDASIEEPGQSPVGEVAQKNIETSVTYLGLQKDETSCGYWTAAILSTVVRSTNQKSVMDDFKTEVEKSFTEVTGQDSPKKQELEEKTYRVIVAMNQHQGSEDVSALNAAVGDRAPSSEEGDPEVGDEDDIISIGSGSGDEEEGLDPEEPSSKQQKP
jgi:hypothetical protein